METIIKLAMIEGDNMQKDYIEQRGMIRKRSHSTPEYWWGGKKILRGPEVCQDADPESPPTEADWKFCAMERDKKLAK